MKYLQLKTNHAKDYPYCYVNFEERQISNSILISSTEINIVKIIPLEYKQAFLQYTSYGRNRLK